MAHVERLRGKGNRRVEIHLVRGRNLEGKQMYTYLAIYSHRVPELTIALVTRTTDLDEFGVILASGVGEPDEATKRHVQKMLRPPDEQSTT